jgi:hypothetical protein
MMMNVDFSSTNKVFFTKKTSLINENERETPRLLPLTMGGFLSSGSVSLLLFFYIFLFYFICRAGDDIRRLWLVRSLQTSPVPDFEAYERERVRSEDRSEKTLLLLLIDKPAAVTITATHAVDRWGKWLLQLARLCGWAEGSSSGKS